MMPTISNIEEKKVFWHWIFNWNFYIYLHCVSPMNLFYKTMTNITLG